jgi:hypothetical protein
MYSHALATYQKALIVFWEKTSKTMSAVAESFKGYQYYEFTVIKDLAEPSRLLAEKNSKSLATDKSKEKDDALININETKPITSINNNQNDPTEPVNALIDISDDQLNDQLLELEKLTTIDRTSSTSANTKTENLLELSNTAAEHDKLFSDLLSPLSSANPSTDLLGINDTNSFAAHWAAAFGNTSNQQQQQQQISAISTEPTNNSFLPSSLLSELLTSMNKNNKPIVPTASNNPKPKPITTTKTTDKSNWLNLFAELDPLQNPDAIGKSTGDEADRSC